MNAKGVCLLIFIVNTIDSRFYNDDRDDYFSKRRAMLQQDNDDDLEQQLRSLFLNHQKRTWQSYVDHQLVGAGLAAGAIIGLHDGNTWAASDGFSLKPGEGAAIVKLFENPNDVFSKGITVNGVNYIGIKVYEDSIYGKQGPGGVILVKTVQTILIGIYYENMQTGKAARIVERLADYLKQSDY